VTNYLEGKSVVVTGAGSGFGRLVSGRAAALGAKVTCADVNAEALDVTVKEITASGGTAQAVTADVTDIAQMKALAARAIAAYGAIDVMLNNAGVMPLAFYADHEAALEKWHRCIDINIKGVLNGTVAVFDQMMAQGHGHVINVSSIYGNFPVVGAGVYGASKAAVNFLSESLRMESRGKIKVTIVKPTGVPLTNLGTGVINPEAIIGIVGHNGPEYLGAMRALATGQLDAEKLNPENQDYVALDPGYIADQVIHAMNQPRGVSIGDITIRAAGDHYIL
jgi:NADP-dependent 3-hydroxy acid dehydrogenase YdfG